MSAAHAAAAEVSPVAIAQLLAQGRDLFKAHYEEVGNLGLPLFVDEGLFYALEEKGALISLGCFTLSNRLIGYAVATCTPHPFAEAFVCSVQAVFVHKGYRRCGNGNRLLDTMEHEAAARGAVLVWHARKGSALEFLLQKRGCSELETIYESKRC